LEYKPLFGPGFHDISSDDVEKIFVEPFSDSTQRELLAERFKAFLAKLEEVGISFEIWLNGSFATKKLEPVDIDVAIFANPDQINNLPQDKMAILRYLFDDLAQTKYRYHCDVYFVMSNDKQKRSYWRGWFGFSRNEYPKGIPRLRI
jgi:hypothetical protein